MKMYVYEVHINKRILILLIRFYEQIFKKIHLKEKKIPEEA